MGSKVGAPSTSSEPFVGRAIPHESADLHVTGAALYTDDLATRYPRCLSGWPVQAPHAHALLTKLDVSPALAVPGVVRVLTAADVPGRNDTGCSREDEPLFPRAAKDGDEPEILFHGMPVAWVLGETLEAAKLGAKAVVHEYQALTPILTLDEAIQAGAFHHTGEKIARGDVKAAMAAAPHRLSGRFEVGGQEHFYLEMHSSLAVVDEAGSVLVHASTQHPTETQMIVAHVLDRPSADVVVQQLRMGGGFGGKETQANPFAAIAALGATLTKRPVRVTLDRVRDMQLSGKRHPFRGDWEIGFDAQGKVLAWELALTSDGGHSLDLSFPVLGRALFHSDNAYFLPNVLVTGRVAKTHKISNTAFRGFGGPQGMVMIEDAIEHVARALDLPAHVVRERNLYREGDTTHYEQPVKDAARIERIWSELKSEATFDARRAEVLAFNAANPHQKRGIAITPVKFGISFTAKFFNQAGALVLVYRDGSVHVNHGGTEMGQGLYTKIRQIAADTLGVDLAVVRTMPTRTDKVPNTSATAASAGTDLNGAAVRNACLEIRGRLLEVASRRLGVPPDEITLRGGRVYKQGASGAVMEVRELVDSAYLERVQLWASGFYKTPGIHWDGKAGRGKPFHYFAYGAAITEVEVDGFTGMYGLRRVDVVHDVGDSISPKVDIGQIEGAFAQGAGWLTQEELVWDPKGVLRTSNASTYKLPSLGECPPVFRVRLLSGAREETVVMGSKAVGEPPFMLAISVHAALREAVSAFAPAHRREPVLLAAPATAEQVYWAVESVRPATKSASVSATAPSAPRPPLR